MTASSERQSAESGSQRVPAPLRVLLDIDVLLTDKFCNLANNFLPFRSLTTHYKMLEISCHGIPWLAGLLAFIWLVNSPGLYRMQANLFFGLVLDLIIVGVCKSIARRRRPLNNRGDMFMVVSVDKFSFPSGHATRALFVTYFFCFLWPVPWILRLPFVAWSVSVSLSRVLLRRHYLLDVIGGAVIGYTEGLLLGFLWLSEGQSKFFISFISDDVNAGAEYDV